VPGYVAGLVGEQERGGVGDLPRGAVASEWDRALLPAWVGFVGEASERGVDQAGDDDVDADGVGCGVLGQPHAQTVQGGLGGVVGDDLVGWHQRRDRGGEDDRATVFDRGECVFAGAGVLETPPAGDASSPANDAPCAG
jgi:hypothetical protein